MYNDKGKNYTVNFLPSYYILCLGYVLDIIIYIINVIKVVDFFSLVFPRLRINWINVHVNVDAIKLLPHNRIQL